MKTWTEDNIEWMKAWVEDHVKRMRRLADEGMYGRRHIHIEADRSSWLLFRLVLWPSCNSFWFHKLLVALISICCISLYLHKFVALGSGCLSFCCIKYDYLSFCCIRIWLHYFLLSQLLLPQLLVTLVMGTLLVDEGFAAFEA